VNPQITAWDVNPFEFDAASEGLGSDVASLTISLPSEETKDPIVVKLPRKAPPIPAANCTSHTHCNGCPDDANVVGCVPSGRCDGEAGTSNGTTTIVNGKCVCDSRFNGGDCSEIATCQYWDFATEMWSGEGCEIQLQVHRRAARAGDRSAVRRCASARADRPASRSPRRRAAARSATARTSRTSRASRRRWCHPGLGLSQ
jgi:hypothetical protein